MLEPVKENMLWELLLHKKPKLQNDKKYSR